MSLFNVASEERSMRVRSFVTEKAALRFCLAQKPYYSFSPKLGKARVSEVAFVAYSELQRQQPVPIFDLINQISTHIPPFKRNRLRLRLRLRL